MDHLYINSRLVVQLLKSQFHQWADLAIQPVEVSGHDNRTFRLGDELLVRLPSAACYAKKVVIEQIWLPYLAQHLTIKIPEPIAMGNPSSSYPWHWSVYRWIDGKSANTIALNKEQLAALAKQLASFIKELHAIPANGAPRAGAHNFYRGGSLGVYDKETVSLLKQLAGIVDSDAAQEVWKEALSSGWDKPPVWIHGDMALGNIIINDGALHGIIDFGGMAVGDPACDLVIAWTFFNDESRRIFKESVDLDDATWMRARGWALWKALFELAQIDDKESEEAMKQRKIIKQLSL